MTPKAQIKEFIASLQDRTKEEIDTLHKLVLKISPKCKLWFSDGRDEKGKVVANPTIGYGSFDIKYANGSEKEWFQIGISPNKSGISVYILGIEDKSYLIKTFGKKLGKASVTEFSIKFKKIEEINIDVLNEAIRFGFVAQN